MIPLKSLTATAMLATLPWLAGCANVGQLADGEPNTTLTAAMAGEVADLEPAKPSATGVVPPPAGPLCIGPGVEPAVQHQKECYWRLKNLIDDTYRRYKISLLHAVNTGNFVADTLSEGLDVAGAITPGAAARGLFSALAGGATAEKGLVNSDILYKQTVTIIIKEMDTDRADVSTNNKQDLVDLGKVDAGNNATLAWGQIVNDLLAYYEAGTFQHAIVSLDTKASNSSTSTTAQAQAAADAAAAAAGGQAAPVTPAPKNSGDRRNLTANGKPVN